MADVLKKAVRRRAKAASGGASGARDAHAPPAAPVPRPDAAATEAGSNEEAVRAKPKRRGGITVTDIVVIVVLAVPVSLLYRHVFLPWAAALPVVVALKRDGVGACARGRRPSAQGMSAMRCARPPRCAARRSGGANIRAPRAVASGHHDQHICARLRGGAGSGGAAASAA